MLVKKTLVLSSDDILNAVRLFVGEKGFDAQKVCNIRVHEDRDGDTQYDLITVELQEERI